MQNTIFSPGLRENLGIVNQASTGASLIGILVWISLAVKQDDPFWIQVCTEYMDTPERSVDTQYCAPSGSRNVPLGTIIGLADIWGT